MNEENVVETVSAPETAATPSAEIPVETEAPPDAESDLRAENERLRERIADYERERAELAELREFAELYPGVSPDNVPDSARVPGLPLSAAYALFLRRAELERAEAERVNSGGRERSAGNARNDGGSAALYTLDEIRGMSPRDVKRNYISIIKSLAGR